PGVSVREAFAGHRPEYLNRRQPLTRLRPRPHSVFPISDGSPSFGCLESATLISNSLLHSTRPVAPWRCVSSSHQPSDCSPLHATGPSHIGALYPRRTGHQIVLLHSTGPSTLGAPYSRRTGR